jgi:hypothetical protein
MKRKFAIAGVLALVGVGLATAPAGADPKPVLDLVLTCPEPGDTTRTFPVSVAGNGAWVPVHDLGTTLVGVPIAFGEFSGTFTPTSGPAVTFSEPPFEKPRRPATRNFIITCDYTIAGPAAKIGGWSGPDGVVVGAGTVVFMLPRVHYTSTT